MSPSHQVAAAVRHQLSSIDYQMKGEIKSEGPVSGEAASSSPLSFVPMVLISFLPEYLGPVSVPTFSYSARREVNATTLNHAKIRTC